MKTSCAIARPSPATPRRDRERAATGTGSTECGRGSPPDRWRRGRGGCAPVGARSRRTPRADRWRRCDRDRRAPPHRHTPVRRFEARSPRTPRARCRPPARCLARLRARRSGGECLPGISCHWVRANSSPRTAKRSSGVSHQHSPGSSSAPAALATARMRSARFGPLGQAARAAAVLRWDFSDSSHCASRVSRSTATG